MKNKYTVIIPDSVGYNVSENFETLEKSIEYGVLNNYGRGFEIAKRVDYKITAE